MRLISVFVPVICLILVSATDAQESAPGPLRRAITREAVRGVLDSPHRAVPSNWTRVTALATGTDVTLTVQGRPPVGRVIAAADDSQLTTLNLTNPGLPPKARRALLNMAERFPRVIGSPGAREFKEGPVTLSTNGLFVDASKVAEFREVVDMVDRNDVREISIDRRRGSVAGALIGGGAGFALGFLTSITLANKQCNGSCAPVKALMTVSLVGLPALGVALGYSAGGIHQVRDIVYRNPVP
jgi:hypothetical protein